MKSIRTVSYVLSAALVLTLIGCTQPPVTGKLPAQEGEMCGGIASFPCAEGLTCYVEKIYPDASGICIRDTSSSSSIDNAMSKAEAEAFIRANIVTLSPIPAVVGGVWYVTEIAWDEAGTATVNYEDGHIAAKAQARITTQGGESKVEFLNAELL